MKRNRPRAAGAPALEWLSDVSGRSARITSMGSNALLVENHCGILEFTQEKIVLSTHCGMLEISGSALCLSQVRAGALMIRGSIADVKLPCEGEQKYES